MTSVAVEYQGKRFVSKITAMQPLQQIVVDASQNFKLDPSQCQLQLNKKNLDLSTPFRIANLPTGAKLTLVSRQKPQSAQQQQQQIPDQTENSWKLPNSSVQHLQNSNPPTQQSTQLQAAPASQSKNQEQPLQSPQIQNESQQQEASKPEKQQQSNEYLSKGPITSNQQYQKQDQQTYQPPNLQSDLPSTSKQVGQQNQPEQIQVQQDQNFLAKRDLNDFQYFVYTEKELQLYRTIQQQITSLNYQLNEGSQDFYEFNSQDFRQVQQAKKLKENQNSGLKTQKLREMEEENKAKQYKTAVIRLLFPDHVVVEIRMNPLDKVSTLVKIAKQSLHEYLSEDFYLFTTPPKQIIDSQEESKTLWRAGFVPAANVRVGFKSIDQQNMGQKPSIEVWPPYINVDVMDRIGIEPPEMQSIDPQQKQALLKQGEQNLEQQRNQSKQGTSSFFGRSSSQQAASQFKPSEGLHNVHGINDGSTGASGTQQYKQQQSKNTFQNDDFQDDEEQNLGNQLKQSFKNVGDKMPKWLKLGKK